MRRVRLGWYLALAASLGCGRFHLPADEAARPQATGPAAYDPGSGELVVHEWGTLTHVVGSDGALLPGLHHEDEDLPGFVADRMAQVHVTPDQIVQKMETPVTYFYSPTSRKVAVKVDFPRGIFTQWFPYVRRMEPPVYQGEGGEVVDPWLSTSVSLPPSCAPRYERGFVDGRLDWGEVEILEPGADVALAGPTTETTYGLARNTRANPLRLELGGQRYHEKFLFYRGLGDFALPLRVTAGPTDEVRLVNTDAQNPMRGAILMHVSGGVAGFTRLGDVPAGNERSSRVPEASLPLPDFVARLREALTEELTRDGLYLDEAKAMVDTWERSYFTTPGVRLLYLLPQKHTEAIIPLKIAPAPDRIVRTMVIRVEILSPSYEKVLVDRLSLLGGVEAEQQAARAFFFGLGRFAEPHLRRALSLTTSATVLERGHMLLSEVRANRRWAPSTAE